MIQVSNGGKHFGFKTLFEGLGWLITPNERVGIVGGNGTGKSTLLKVLAGIEQLDHGSLNPAKGTRIGYLPQEGLMMRGRTVFQECMSVFDPLRALEAEMETLLHRMSDLSPESPEYAQVADRFHQFEMEFVTRDGYALDSKVGTVLSGLQFPRDDWDRPCEEFSGGWQMRIALAKLLLDAPDLLLMDEPTNHLDIEARNWLEDYLNSYPHAFILISHDRYFLDVTVKKIVEIWNKKVHFYPGNYEKYEAQKAERIAQIAAAYTNQQAKIEQLEAFINRFRAQATKAKQVQSRIKELERMEKVEPPPPDEKAIKFSFPSPTSSGRIVAEVRGLGKSYGAKNVLRDVSLLIERGDKVALVGHNGAGKSTLIKLLAGTEPLTAGEYKLGHNVMMEYFAQDQYKELDPNASLIDDLSNLARSRTSTELRNLLGCFLFSGDDVEKKMGVLSGGERNRYALARLLLKPSNFLLLDEPTNHLDMRSKNVLLEALSEYIGTVLFVSHDRYFMDKLATRVFEVGGGEVKIYPGNYEDYLWRISGQSLPSVDAIRAAEAVSAPTPTASTPAVAAPAEPPKARVNPIKIQKMRDRLKAVEAEMAALETVISDHSRELANFVSVEDTTRRTAEIDKSRATIDKLMAEWEELSQSLDEAGASS
ncbi:MAG: ABC-F family ATP-binding cassette domain-containing protein [Acidobacteria bacterium]|nr:ABC-F family ATP-binding cassette domain-containing protein [Acidobacteriota bacterium]